MEALFLFFLNSMKEFFKKIVVLILRWEAKLVLKKYQPRIVAVTGSVGKTSTKDAIFAVLSQHTHVRGSDKSFNSEIGLPLTILGCPNAWQNPLRWLQNILDGLFLILLPAKYPKWLVLEVGADRPGDISSLSKWLRVDVAVITRLPEVPVHVEFFDSPAAVVEEKASLINALKPHGTLVVYADDERSELLLSRAAARKLHVVTFGFSEGAEVRGSDFAALYADLPQSWPVGMNALLSAQGRSLVIEAPGVFGAHALLSLVAAAAVGVAVGMSLQNISVGIAHYKPPKGRMRLLPGLKGSLVIDDTYNSSPAAVMAALDSLKACAPNSPGRGRAKKHVRKIAVLGDMLELGRLSVEEHRKIGAYVAKRADCLVTVGFRARDIAQGALGSGMRDEAILQYEDATKAGEELQAMVTENDCVLVKGSQSIRMEKIVERLMNEPEKASQLLVRQESEWRKR